jgi:hypothetical protein
MIIRLVVQGFGPRESSAAFRRIMAELLHQVPFQAPRSHGKPPDAEQIYQHPPAAEARLPCEESQSPRVHMPDLGSRVAALASVRRDSAGLPSPMVSYARCLAPRRGGWPGPPGGGSQGWQGLETPRVVGRTEWGRPKLRAVPSTSCVLDLRGRSSKGTTLWTRIFHLEARGTCAVVTQLGTQRQGKPCPSIGHGL